MFSFNSIQLYKQLIYIILFNEWLTITIILAKIIAIHFQQVELKVKKHWYRNKLQLLKSFLGMQKKCIRNNRQNIIDNNITSCKVWSVYKVNTFYCSSVVYRLCNLQLDVTPKILKYFPVLARYSSARNLCKAEGGDLIRFDSQEKFDIFKDYHGMFDWVAFLKTLNDLKVL